MLTVTEVAVFEANPHCAAATIREYDDARKIVGLTTTLSVRSMARM